MRDDPLIPARIVRHYHLANPGDIVRLKDSSYIRRCPRCKQYQVLDDHRVIGPDSAPTVNASLVCTVPPKAGKPPCQAHYLIRDGFVVYVD